MGMFHHRIDAQSVSLNAGFLRYVYIAAVNEDVEMLLVNDVGF
jgi:hypothetical protein